MYSLNKNLFYQSYICFKKRTHPVILLLKREGFIVNKSFYFIFYHFIVQLCRFFENKNYNFNIFYFDLIYLLIKRKYFLLQLPISPSFLKGRVRMSFLLLENFLYTNKFFQFIQYFFHILFNFIIFKSDYT